MFGCSSMVCILPSFRLVQMAWYTCCTLLVEIVIRHIRFYAGLMLGLKSGLHHHHSSMMLTLNSQVRSVHINYTDAMLRWADHGCTTLSTRETKTVTP